MSLRQICLLLALSLLAACAEQGKPEPAAVPVVAKPPVHTTPADIARSVVAKRTGSDPASIEILSSEFVQFRDSSLDCPLEGRSYLQVITPGHRVIVKAQDRQFDVRVAGGFGRICERRKDSSQRTD